MNKRLSTLVLAALILAFVVPAQPAQAKLINDRLLITKDTTIGPGEKWIIHPGGEVIIQSGAQLIINGGTIENSGRLTNDGHLVSQGGTLKNNDGGRIFNDRTAELHGTTVINSGTFTQYFLDSHLILDASSQFDNRGTFENSLTGVVDNGGIFANSGTFDNRGEAIVNNTGAFRNSGAFANDDLARVNNRQLFENRGDITNSSQDYISNYGAFLNSGTINNNLGRIWSDNAFLNAGHIYNREGGLSIYGGQFVNAGFLGNVADIQGISIGEKGRFDNTEQGFIFNVSDRMWNNGQFYNFGAFDNPGKFTNRGVFTDGPGGLITQETGEFENYGTYIITPEEHEPTPINEGVVNNYGLMAVDGYYAQGGTLNNYGVINNNSSHTIDNTGIINNFQTIHNTLEGTIGNFADLNNDGDLINDGEIYNQGVIDNQGAVHNFGNIHNLWGGVITGDPAIDHACRLALSAEAVLVGQPVTATVTVISPTVDAVTFHWTDPTPTLRRTFDDTAAPFADSFAPDLAGDWTVEAVCLEGLTALDTVTVTLTVDDDADGDGVGDTVEDGAPGSGDGNADGTADWLQGHVASLLDAGDWRYLTLVSPADTALAGVGTVENPSPDDAPAVEFPLGFLDFTIQGLAPGGALSATLVISPPAMVDTYYNLGPTAGDPTDHWYEFLFDGTTGAEVISDTVVLHLVDGARGDGDLQVNGQIVGLGAPGVVQRADLALWKAGGPDPVDLGEVLTYTLSLANWGHLTATHVILTDSLPLEIDFVAAGSSQGACAESGGAVVCDLGDLAPLLQATVTLTTTAVVPGWIVNEAQVAGGGLEVDFYDNDARAWTFVQTDEDLSISVSDYLDPVPLGEVITYSLLVANNGVYTATGLIVTDTLPAGTAFVSAEPSQGTCAEAGGTVTCDLGDLPSRWYAEVIVVVTPANLGEVTNRAGVVGNEAEPVLVNNRDEERTTIIEAATHTIYLPLILR